MLPWWFWVLLWTVLVLAALLYLLYFGLRLFRQGMKTLHSAGEAADQLGQRFAQEGTVVQYTPNPRRYPHGTDATHADPEKMKKLVEKGKLERIEARRQRRVARRSARGQAQNMRDLHLF